MRNMHPACRHLEEDHARIDQLSVELDGALSADRATIQEIWTRLERALLAHFDAEERWLFPLFSADHPEEILALQQQHARLRRLVSEAGVAADLRTLRSDQTLELLSELRAHAKREDDSIYGWLEQLPEPSKLEELIEALVRRAGGVVLG